MHGDEHYLNGGITAPDGTRTDVYLKENGPNAEGFHFDLHLVTGNMDACFVECPPKDLRSFALWVLEVIGEGNRFAKLERLAAACDHDSDGLPGRVREAYEALDD